MSPEAGWIDLAASASKYNVSMSTLRRRIRSKSIEHKLSKGRYWLPDQPETIEAAPLYVRPVSQTIKSHLPGGPALEEENRRLKAEIEELQTLVQALENELSSK